MDAAAKRALVSPRVDPGLLDLPTEVLSLVAAALLRCCYQDAHPAPPCRDRAMSVPDRATLTRQDGAFWSTGLVDAPTWRAVAPATAVCRALRDALFGAVGGVHVAVDRKFFLESAYNPATSVLLDGGSHGDAYWEPPAFPPGCPAPLSAGCWLYFFPVGEEGREVHPSSFTARLDRFLRSCPRLQTAVDVLDGAMLCPRSGGQQEVFLFRPSPVGADAAVAAAAAHLGVPLVAYWDVDTGRFAEAVEAAAAAGSPRLRGRGLLVNPLHERDEVPAPMVVNLVDSDDDWGGDIADAFDDHDDNNGSDDSWDSDEEVDSDGEMDSHDDMDSGGESAI